MLVPITATGLFVERRVPRGRDAQSIAFFRAPGTDPLYSGVANQDGVGAGDRVAQRLHLRVRRLDVVVLVVGRDRLRPS